MTVDSAALKIARHFDELSNILHSGQLHAEADDHAETDGPSAPVDAALQRLVSMAEATIPGCDWACITEVPGENKPPRTRASSSHTALQVDDLQYRFGEGPCLEAAASAHPVISPDLRTETRWPAFVAAAVTETPVRGVLSFDIGSAVSRASLKLAPHASLNIYGREPGALDSEAVSAAAVFAAHARVLLRHLDSAHRAANLSQALKSSRTIGAAIGVIMSADKVTAEQAFDKLHRASALLHRKLRDVAQEVTDTGRLPDGGHAGDVPARRSARA